MLAQIRCRNSFATQVLKIVLFAISLNLTVASAQTEKRSSSGFSAKVADGLIEQIRSIVNSCQEKAVQTEAMRQISYQSRYELELSKTRLERAEAGIRLMDIDYVLARDKASKSVEADAKQADESIAKCKETAKLGMDQEVKNLVSTFSAQGMSKEIKSFVAAWYTSLQSVGTDRFKEQQARMDGMAENLKLEIALRGNSSTTSKGK